MFSKQFCVGWTCTATLMLGMAAAYAGDDEKPAKKQRPIVGRWDMIVQTPEGEYPSWLEVQLSGYTTLVGSFVGQFGSARPIGRVEFENGRLRFSVPPQWETRKDDLRFDGRLEGDVLRGETTDEKGRQVTWTARRAPSLKRSQPPRWREPIELINGNDLTGWKARSAGVKNGWIVRDGALVNATPGNDLITERKFTDFELHVEFQATSNSGVYLQGRYEIQIDNSLNAKPGKDGKLPVGMCGAIYGQIPPSKNMAKPPKEWQSFDVTFRAPRGENGKVTEPARVTLIWNGEKVIDDAAIKGPTGAALDGKVLEPGPLLLQGDHGRVAFRNIKIRPLTK